MLNIIFPYNFFSNDILNIQHRVFDLIDENIVFADNSRKRRRFNTFIEQIINKNNDFVEQIKQKEAEDDNLSNYEEYSVEENIQDFDTEESVNDDSLDEDSSTDTYDETIIEKKNV